MKKKVIAALLAAVLAAGSLGACGGETKTTESSQEGQENGKVKLTALVNKHSLTKDLDEIEWLKEIEEKAGVEIEWQQISADWDQKKSAMFASGEIPDLLFNATADSDYVQYQGLFENLEPLIEENAPNIKEMFEEHPETKTLAQTENGEIYGVPSYQAVWPKVSGSMLINKTWLDNLNLEVPTTWEELK